MSYTSTRGVLDDIVNFVGGNAQGIRNIITAVDPVMEIARDPALPQVLESIAELHMLEQGPPGSPEVHGVGLRHLVNPLKGYVAFRRNPIIVGAVAAAIVLGLPYFFGYNRGRGR